MFFEEDDKDTSRNMDDHDLDFESEDSVSWDKLLEETDVEQPQVAADQTSADLVIGDDQSFDDLIGEEPLDMNKGAGENLNAQAPADYSFDLAVEGPVNVHSFSEYEQPAASEEPEELDYQTAPSYKAPAPDEEYDAAGYDYNEETVDPVEPQPSPQRRIPGGSLAEDSPKEAPKKNNAGLLGVLAAVMLVVVLGAAFMMFGKDLIPGLAGASTGDVDELSNTDPPISQDAALPGDDPMAPPSDAAQAPAPDAAAQTAPVDNSAQAPEQPGVSKKVEDKNAAKDPKAAKVEPGRGKVLLPVVSTGRANPFTPLVNYNSLGFITKPNMGIPEPPTDLGNLTDTLDKLQKITVSGILYDSVKPSAIVKVSGVDYFVQKGDKVNTYVVADITQTTVTLKEGANAYRASIGQSFSGAGALDGQINVGNTKQRQYVSANDVDVSVNVRPAY